MDNQISVRTSPQSTSSLLEKAELNQQTMEPATEDEILKQLKALLVLFPEAIRDLDEFESQMFFHAYTSVLSGTPRHLLSRGIMRVAKTCKWFPKPAEIVDLIAQQKKMWLYPTNDQLQTKRLDHERAQAHIADVLEVIDENEVNPDMQAKLSALASGSVKR